MKATRMAIAAASACAFSAGTACAASVKQTGVSLTASLPHQATLGSDGQQFRRRPDASG